MVATRLRRWLHLDRYTVVGWLLFPISIVYIWRGYVRSHEGIYLLGSRCVADPEFLAVDLVWKNLPPTTFAFDHLLAPLWSVFDDFGIVVVGRIFTQLLLAWSLASLARTMRLPPWSVVVGFTAWVLWRGTLAACGKPIEGFQPKSFAYPLIFFSLSHAIRGQTARAGVAAGIGTVFHIIVGGWACLALFLSMLVNRQLFSLRQLGVYLLSTAPFIGPLVLVVALFHSGGMETGGQAVMDEIYVTFSQANCVDPNYFMSPERWARVILIFSVSPLLVFLWPERRAARVVGVFVLMLIAFHLLGMLASTQEAYWLLKLYPFQLANAIPALFLLVLCLALAGEARPQRLAGRIVWIAGVLVAIWMIDQEDVISERIVDVPVRFAESLERVEPGRFSEKISRDRQKAYAWIRDETPVRSVFITPNLPEFWTYAERAQVAAFRHPPHDQGLIEWKQRLEAMNGFEDFPEKGSIRTTLTANEGRLTVEQLIRIRDLYGATHYLTLRKRGELEPHLLHNTGDYFVYDVKGLGPGG